MKRFIILLMFLMASLFLYAPDMNYTVKDYKWQAVMHLVKEKRKAKQREFNRFLKDLGYWESGNNWKVYNSIGYIGEWQFGKLALEEVGLSHVTFKKFRKDPSIFTREIQLKAVTSLVKINEKLLSKYINSYEGRTVNGLLITKSGLLAACHLGGARSVKLFLKSNGRINRRDIYGTSIGHYLLLFKNYDF